ncbi:unnamed protein product [Phytomonas sp. Hart1]|nr:unnamed protein product [Phytomonas sp. Hart1]|eukprot:CCW68175.1 unnamed protein product [Phytomonas sp. isolate Hart1]
MKIILKSITGKLQDLEVSEATTVLEIKKTLEAEYDMSTLRLCFKGDILADTLSVQEAKIAENDTLIIAGKKRSIPKPLPSPPSVLSTASRATASACTEPQPPSGDSAEGQPSPPPPTPPASTPLSGATPDSTSDINSSLIDGIVAMGFEDRAQVALALRAAYLNPDRAVEYLCTGIPPGLLRTLSPPDQTAPAPTSTTSEPPPPSTALQAVSRVQPEPGSSDLRAALWTIPHFDDIRAVFQSNQESLPVVIQQIRDRYPNIFQLIELNQEEFLRIMNETAGQPGNPITTADDRNPMDTLPVEIRITESDRAAVRQLVELGGGMWDEQSALMVYIATQRNQEIAANILFENGGVPPALLEQLAAQLHHLGEEENDESGEMEGGPR